MNNQTKTNKQGRKRPCYDLSQLLEQITPDNQPESFDDPSVGEEML